MKSEEAKEVWDCIIEVLPYVYEPNRMKAELSKLIHESSDIKELIEKIKGRTDEQGVIKRTDLQIVVNRLEKLIRNYK
ncbi:MAG: hypothetical protein QXK12_02445 [Candidatus Nezhaarchaeales archaeon]